MIDQALLDALPMEILVLDRNGHVLHGNVPGETRGAPWSQLEPAAFEQLLREGKPMQRGRTTLRLLGVEQVLVMRQPRSALQHLVHSLRQPLTNLMGYTALITHPSASPEQRAEAIEVVQRAAQEMTDLLAAASREEP